MTTFNNSNNLLDLSFHARDVARTFKGGGGSPADTNNYDRLDVPIALNTREV